MDNKTKDQISETVTTQTAGVALGVAIGTLTDQTLKMNAAMPGQTAVQVGQAIGNAAANGAGLQGSLLAGAAVVTAKVSVITAGVLAAAPIAAGAAALGAVGWGLYKLYAWVNQEPTIRIAGFEFEEDHVKINVRCALRDCNGVPCRVYMRFERAGSGMLLNEPQDRDESNTNLFAPTVDITPGHDGDHFNFATFTIPYDLLKDTLGEGTFNVRCSANVCNVPAWTSLGTAVELFTFNYSIPRWWQFWRGGRVICECVPYDRR